MLQHIIDFSIRNKLIIGLFIVALIGWGTYEVTQLPIDAVPDITDNQVQVITVSPALGATDVERLVTFPVEQACSNIPGLKNIRSFSRFGLSLVTIVFKDGVDLYWARQQISERLLQVRQSIPNGVGFPEMAPVTTGLGEIYQYVVRPEKGYEQKYSVTELRTLQDWVVRRQLLGTPGVADVSSFGGKLKQYEITVSPQQLKAYGLTIADVFTALENNNENTGGAYIEKGPTVLYIRTEGLTKSLADIEKIIVKVWDNGTPVLVRDVATVGFGHATRYGAMCYNDQGEVAGAVVMMLKGENSSAVIRNVKNKIVEIQKSLPKGVIIEPFLDRTKMVNNAINTVKTNLLEGALIVVFVLVFFLGNLRAGLIVSSIIPLSMLFAIILMNLFGVGGNLMSLGAIDFGLIVDGSVIVVEAILHRFSHSKHFAAMNRLTQDQMDNEVGTSTGSMIKSAVFSQIIILIVYIPILSLQGIEGKMFKPMAYTVGFAILGAFLLSITYVPMMSALFLKKKISHTKTVADRMMAWFERRYQPLLQKVLSAKLLILTSTFALFALAVFVLMNMGGEFIPQLEEGDFAVEVRLLTGSNLNTSIETTQKTSTILLDKFPEVEKVVTKIGSSEIPTDPMPLEASDMMVILKDKSEWTSAKSFPELADKMGKALAVVPGVSVGFQFPVQMRFNELMTGARQDVVCKIFGEDLDSLARYSKQLGDIIGTVNGATALYVESVTGMPQVVINYNRDAMIAHGLSIHDINNTVNAAFAGQAAGQVYEGERRFDLVVRLEERSRKTVEDIRNLLIPATQGRQVPLYQIASIEETEGPNQIQRENTRRRIIVGFNISGRDVQSIVTELQAKVITDLKLPPGYTITYGGAFENLTGAKKRLSVVVPVALVLIFLLLYFAFNSVKQGLLIYSAIPLSAVGGIFALWVRDMPFSISAGVGFIALFGVAVLNGILLVSEFNRLKKEGWIDTKRVVIHATKSKLRAVLMTALVPSLGFIPMAISQGAGAEVQKPLATVVIGGLIFSTLLTLFVLPLLYVMMDGKKFSLRPKHLAIPVLLCYWLLPLEMSAQQQVTVEQSIELAVRNNTDLTLARLNERYYETLTKHTFNPDKAAVGFEYGQINSNAIDNKFTVSQGIDFPTVYRQQKNLARTDYRISQLETQLGIINLKAEVKRRFYELRVLQEKEKLLGEANERYTQFLNKVEKRFTLGDADVLERSTAKSQQLQIDNQINILRAAYQMKLGEFRLLLNVSELVEPQPGEILYLVDFSDTSIVQSPVMALATEAFNRNVNAHKLEKSRLYPSFSASYNNVSFIGYQRIGNEERYFDRSDRFSYMGVGLGIPLFYGAQRAKIKAASVHLQSSQVRAKATEQKLKLRLTNVLRYYQELSRQVAIYQTVLLPEAQLILEAADKRLNSGEIGYLQWVMLVNQSVSIRNEYSDVVQRHNETAFELEQLNGSN
jgi:cobalt-zinc-cadmium resistance protein CzcA